MTRTTIIPALALALGLFGCDNSARIEQERRDLEMSSRLLEADGDLQRVEAGVGALEQSVQSLKDSHEQTRQAMARLEQEAAERGRQRAQEAKPSGKRAPSGKAGVAALQEALARAGYDPGPADGRMGRRTKQALRSFQKDRGLKVDGVAGPRTRAALGL